MLPTLEPSVLCKDLMVTLDTVKRDMSHIFEKLSTAKRTEAVVRGSFGSSPRGRRPADGPGRLHALDTTGAVGARRSTPLCRAGNPIQFIVRVGRAGQLAQPSIRRPAVSLLENRMA